MSASAERLYNLLPAVYRIRDSAQGEPLRALLAILESELKALDADIEGLYENWFIETCEEWVAPYIGDLLGVRGLKPISGGTFSARPYIAHTLGYRRRKGTAAMLEQLARDVTNWPARVVEFFQFLDTTQYLNHLRPQNVITPDLRDTNSLELLSGPFDPASRTLEVRTIADNRGKYNVSNIGIFLWRLEGYPLTLATARPNSDGADGRYRFNSIGFDAPLFNQPQALVEETRLSNETQVPGMLRRRALYEDLEAVRQGIADGRVVPSAYFGVNPVIQISVAGVAIPPEKIVICDLSDLPSGPGNWPQPPATIKYTLSSGGPAITLPITASIDPVLGRLAFAAGSIPTQASQTLVSYSYGFSGNLGGGPYDRTDSVPAPATGKSSWQVAVTKELPADNVRIFATLTDALRNTSAGWVAQSQGTIGTIAILDSQTYVENPAIGIPDKSQLLIVAADWPALRQGIASQTALEPSGVRPHIRGSVQVTGTAAATSQTPGALSLNGLLLEGSLTVEPGNLGSLQLTHCTVAPAEGGIQVSAQLPGGAPGPPSLIAGRGPILTVPIPRPLPNGGPPPPPPPVITITTTSPLPTATVGLPYSKAFTARAVGGTGFDWSADGLPAWLSMSPAGVLTGTPPAAGPVSFSVTVTDDAGAVRGGSFTLPVNAALVIATTSPLPAATAGSPFSLTFTATGGSGVFVWSEAGAFPWLNMSPAGVLTGTPPAAGSATFNVTVTDNTGASRTASFTLPINAALAIATPSPLPPATMTAPYSQTFAATGGAGGYKWSAAGLPSWLTLSANGVATGTPPALGIVSFSVTVTDSNGLTKTGTFSLAVNPLPLAIATSQLSGGTTTIAYNQVLAGTGGVAPFTWSVTAGSLPPSLTLNPASGAITGVPSAAGTFTFTVQLSDGASSTPATRGFTIVVVSGLSITTASVLPGVTAGAAFSQTLSAAAGTAPLTWSVSAGALPASLSLNTATGAITGLPTAVGQFTFTVKVADSASNSATKVFTLVVAPAPSVTTATLPNGTQNASYSQVLGVAGGTAPFTWSVTAGALPAGMSLHPATGTLSGSPSAAGSASFTVQVKDNSSVTATRSLALAIAPPLGIATASTLPPGTGQVAYSQSLAPSGGTPPYSWSVTSGSLPAGLNLSPAGVLSGTPAGAANASFTAQVTDAAGAVASSKFTLVVAPTLVISASALPPAEVTAPYSVSVTASGGTPPYSWSLAAGALPTPLTLSPSGAITGTPSTPGAQSFTLRVTDSNSVVATGVFQLTVAPLLGIATPAALPGGVAQASYSANLQPSGGAAPYQWSVTAGALPAGLVLLAGGAIHGKPAAAGSFTFTATVTDTAGVTSSRAFTIVIVDDNPILVVSLIRTISGPLTLSTIAQLAIKDSIVDGAGGIAILAPTADANIQTTTVLGAVGSPAANGVRTLQAGNSIFTGQVFVERRQIGCVRFCYVAKDSRTPRRYRCQPDLALQNVNDPLSQAAIRARLTPVFTSAVHGQPGYAQLGSACAPEISTGAEDGAAMGAFDFLKEAQRLDNLRSSLEEYLRFTLEAGIFFVT